MRFSLIKKETGTLKKEGSPFEAPKEKAKQSETKRILITGGHLTPAIAVSDELTRKGFTNIIWIGHRHSQVMDKNDSAEYKYVAKKGLKFVELKAGKLFRVWSADTLLPGLKALINIPVGFFQSIFILLKYKPSLVISFGGYLALPIVIGAFFLRIKRVTHEQTIVSGLSNRIIGKFVNKVFISWKYSEKYFNPKKTIFSGNPVRNSIFEVKGNSFSFESDRPTIYVTGGNQGSNVINQTVVPLLPTLLHEFNIIHQTGNSSVTEDFERCKAVKEKLEDSLARRYIVKDYIYEDEIGDVMNRADIIIGRSGANMCSEIMALAKYSILIPIEVSSHNEQFLNAKALEELGLAKILLQKNLKTESLNKSIYEVLRYKTMGLNLNGKKIETTIEKINKTIKNNSAEIIVSESLKLIDK
ncbi:MAG: UDP-N-acetylglucosamine--N-acetylmuramyl-(pentapeptide) pyrophosphoryl-undecaprenol N-acetylglucosamine transferase [bacterium]